MLKKIITQYLIGLGLALLIMPIIVGTVSFFPEIGWHFLTEMFLIIFIFQILFYYLTTNYSFKWSVLSFIVNFILWSFEQILIQKIFHESFIYQDDNYKIVVFILGGILWVTNKIVLDRILERDKSIIKRESNFDSTKNKR